MNILIAYATTEGQTRRIAEFAAKRIEARGHGAELLDLTGTHATDLDAVDKVILAGSVHQFRHQEELAAFIIANRDKLKTKPSLFMSVSLSAAFPEDEAEAAQYASGFLGYLDWTPDTVLLVAGALRYDEYDFFKSQIIKHVVMAGRQGDVPKGDHEFTDWDAVGTAVDGFAEA